MKYAFSIRPFRFAFILKNAPILLAIRIMPSGNYIGIEGIQRNAGNVFDFIVCEFEGITTLLREIVKCCE